MLTGNKRITINADMHAQRLPLHVRASNRASCALGETTSLGIADQKNSTNGSNHDELGVQGPYPLTGPQLRPADGSLPLRGDLAHIGLAGRHFVPHYAVPQPRLVMPGGASLRTATDQGGEELCMLMEGDSFEVLEIAGGWAWGCLSLEGPTGYVQLDRLEPLI